MLDMPNSIESRFRNLPSISPFSSCWRHTLFICIAGLALFSTPARVHAEGEGDTDKKPGLPWISIGKPNSPGMIVEKEPDEFTAKLITSLFHGAYDDVIAAVSPLIEKQQQENPEQQPDSFLLYARGYSAWRVGRFGMADGDLSRIGNYSPWPSEGRRLARASDVQQRIEAMKQFVPPRNYELKQDGKVVCRVYYTEEDPWTSAIVELLPLAYSINRKLLGREVVELPVFVFQEFEPFTQFHKLHGNGAPPPSWAWASGAASLTFCENNPGGSWQSRDISTSYFKATVVHEFNHAMVHRLTGDATTPRWLTEGLATVAEGKFSTVRAREYVAQMHRVQTTDNLLLLSDLTLPKDFVASQEKALLQTAEHKPAAYPYAQCYSMVNYLMTFLPDKRMAPLLTDLRDQRDFKVVFKKHTGLTEDEFYKKWLGQLPKVAVQRGSAKEEGKEDPALEELPPQELRG